MKKFRLKSGFTLIEIMICIAIIAIMFTGAIRIMKAYHWMTRETYYSSAVRQMRAQEKIVKEMPFGGVPPEVLGVPSDGRIQLSHKHIVDGSVKVELSGEGAAGIKLLESSLYNVDNENGLVTVLDPSCKGKRVIVSYSFLLPDYGEAVTVPKEAPYEIELSNSPVLSIEDLETVQDNRFAEVPLQKIKLFGDTGKLGFDKELAGKIVRVSYIGGMIRNTCSGEFLDDDLKPSSTPTHIKLIKICESYGAKNDLESGVMKVRK